MSRDFRACAWLLTAALLGTALLGVVVRTASAGSALHASAADAPFSTNVLVSAGTTPYPQHVEPTIVVDARGGIVVGWKEALTPDGVGQRVAYASSADGGRTWSENLLKNTTALGRLQSDPWLTLDGSGGLHYASLEYTSDGTEGIVTVTTSHDAARTWSAPVNVDDRPGFADKESMASDGNGTLYVAYDDVLGNTGDQGDRIDLRITHSRDGGATWSPTVSVTDGIGNILGPVLAALPDGTVHAVWWNLTLGDILTDVSHDHGSTWGADVRVNPVAGSAVAINTSWVGSMPSLAVDRLGRLYVAWADRATGNADILVSRSDDGGTSWLAPVRVNDVTTGDQWMPSLAVDARGVVHAAWMDGRTDAWTVEYANSTDGGRTWSANVRVSTAETPLSFTRPGDYLGLAADANGTAYVAWTDGRSGSLAIEFARSTGFPATAPEPFPSAVLVAGLLTVAVVAAVSVPVVLRRRRRSPPAP